MRFKALRHWKKGIDLARVVFKELARPNYFALDRDWRKDSLSRKVCDPPRVLALENGTASLANAM